MSASSQRPSWWRRFRSLPPAVQAASWIGLAVLVIVGIASGGSGAGNTTTAQTSPPPVTTTTGPPPTPTTTPPAPTTTRPAPTTIRPAPTTTPPAPTTSPPAPTTTRPAPATSPPRATPPGSRPPTTALAGLATLPVKGRAPKTGYSRDQFGQAWTDDVTVAGGHNGCDTRNDILRRDLTNIVIKAGTHGCVVYRGVLHDPYTNTVIAFTRGQATSEAVQIDHVVALADAWQTGAQQLTLSARTNLANDPLNLLAVAGAANQQKGDSNAASWLPPNKAFRCSYVAIQVAVKVRYHLWVTRAEHSAIARVLSTCPAQPMPAAGRRPTPGGGPTAATSPTLAPPAPRPTTPAPARPTPAPTTAPPGAPIVRPGAFCSPPGARGVTSRGTPMICKLDSRGERYRWGRA